MVAINDPMLYIGVDIAVKRDNAAVVAVYNHYDSGTFRLWGHRLFKPPVNLATQVEPLLVDLLTRKRVAGVIFDPYQFESTRQRLHEAGFGHKLIECNQQTQMVQAANTLHTHLNQGTLKLYRDADIHSNFSWCAAQQTERGWRIVKQKQSKQIDFVVALAMALMLASGETGHTFHPSLNDNTHGRSVEILP